jgi:hypothetical protein
VRFAGLLVGAAFGVALVIANAHDPLGPQERLGLRLGAALALSALLVLAALAGRGSGGVNPTPMGRRYWIVVGAEVLVLLLGLQMLRLADAPRQENVAWIAFVVGLHFVALALVWRSAGLAAAGTLVFLLGTAGVAMSQSSAVRWVPFVSGVLSGIVLLGGSLLVAAAAYRQRV